MKKSSRYIFPLFALLLLFLNTHNPIRKTMIGKREVNVVTYYAQNRSQKRRPRRVHLKIAYCVLLVEVYYTLKLFSVGAEEL